MSWRATAPRPADAALETEDTRGAATTRVVATTRAVVLDLECTDTTVRGIACAADVAGSAEIASPAGNARRSAGRNAACPVSSNSSA